MHTCSSLQFTVGLRVPVLGDFQKSLLRKNCCSLQSRQGAKEIEMTIGYILNFLMNF